MNQMIFYRIEKKDWTAPRRRRSINTRPPLVNRPKRPNPVPGILVTPRLSIRMSIGLWPVFGVVAVLAQRPAREPWIRSLIYNMLTVSDSRNAFFSKFRKERGRPDTLSIERGQQSGGSRLPP